MRHIHLVLLGTLSIAVGCARQPAPADAPDIRPTLVVEAKPEPAPVVPAKPSAPALPAPGAAADDRQEKFETALAEALKLLADGKQDEALVALETAQTFQDSDFVRGEIAKLKSRIDQDADAQKTVANLEMVLEQGKADDAVQLARDALRELGGSDAAAKLVQLRLQAEALQNAQKSEEPPARLQRFRAEAAAALKDKNLRAAALALEQALQGKDDAALQKQLDDVRASLEKYDSLRDKAAQLRRDPAQLEDALAALQDAAMAWETLPVLQDIDDVKLALQKRRPRVSVADFEVRGDVGIPEPGRAIAEEVLLFLKSKYDLVECGQLAKVVDELKLENNLAGDAANQQEVGKLAKVQYLVLGSISRGAGVTVQARLVDVRSGLIVQTAKIAAATPEELMSLVGSLGKQLLMSDEEKMAFDQEILRQAQKPVAAVVDAPLPPPPQPPAANIAPPPPLNPFTPVPPDFGGLQQGDFNRFSPAPVAGQAPVPLAAGGAVELQIKNRLLQTVLQLGDNEFRRGNPQAAQNFFNLALNLDPGNFDLRLRLTNLQPFLPPVVVNPLFVRPRVAILNFPTFGNPLAVPPYLGTWTPQHLAPYLAYRYDVVEPGEIYWYMARMGLTVRDLMENPYARLWLGRALNVRYFLVGNLVETRSFDVNAYLLDAEYGFVQGQGTIHVRLPFELKLRLGELAAQLLMDPLQRANYLTSDQRCQTLVLQGQQCFDRRAFPEAISAFEAALAIRPGNTQVLFFLSRARTFHQQAQWEEARRQHFLRQQALAAAAAQRQRDLARAAEEARLRAQQNSVVIAVGLRQQAHSALVDQARLALKVGNVSLSISSYRSALALSPSDELYRELALARAQSARNADLAVAQAQAQREADLRRQRDKELALARQQLEQERLRNQALLDAQHKAQEERDRLAYKKAFDEGQQLYGQKKFDGAIASLQAARRVTKTNAVEGLLAAALIEQAKVAAKAKGEDLEQKLAQETKRRRQAEDDAKRNQDLYQASLDSAHKALADKNYQLAQSRYEDAGKLFKSDAVLAGLRKTQQLRQQEESKANDDQQRAARMQKLLADGQADLDAKKYAAAVKNFDQARKLDPRNVDALTGLTKAQELLAKAQELLAKTQAIAQRQAEETKRGQDFQRLLKAGQDNLAAKQYDAAVLALTQAVKLDPKSAAATTALAAAEKARDTSATNQEELRKKALAYQQAMAEGQKALAAKRYEDSLKAFSTASALQPKDAKAAQLLKDAQRAWNDAKSDAADLAKRQDGYQQALAAGQKAFNAKLYPEAIKSLSEAAKLMPGDQKVAALLVQAQEAWKLAKKTADEGAKKKLEEEKRQADFQQLVKQGNLALGTKRYADAQKTFADALKLFPNDTAAQRGYQTATLELNAAKVKPPPPPPVNVKALYQKEMQEAETLEKQGKFADAIKSYQDALKLAPKDAKATQGLRGARLNLHISDGQKDLNAGNFKEAIRHFEAALEISPGNPMAQKLLTKAKQGKK